MQEEEEKKKKRSLGKTELRLKWETDGNSSGNRQETRLARWLESRAYSIFFFLRRGEKRRERGGVNREKNEREG